MSVNPAIKSLVTDLGAKVTDDVGNVIQRSFNLLPMPFGAKMYLALCASEPGVMLLSAMMNMREGDRPKNEEEVAKLITADAVLWASLLLAASLTARYLKGPGDTVQEAHKNFETLTGRKFHARIDECSCPDCKARREREAAEARQPESEPVAAAGAN
ncbi:hypothetical protein PQJ75_00925 [Rhodoplanes sp. TEM]|uniref:Uncharacterized protein n=1 Tax=Rhodoplanes tepidamans TaxID=200616 RepID=A0ABT5J591_RHOTP|nr:MULTISPECIES: hypothetical protein [Rhodoplanes]MDC7784816.1 hypothetical protein [Rhodoplanes tepidamans]MDC7982283.1 hypothetical protein [Rhodoplanes sp. TEM]MDQ0356290.1 hypothetical protein [Rhodoplanes tepidamans]